MILRSIGNVQQTTYLSFTYVSLSATRGQSGEREFVIGWWLVMLQGSDQIVPMELSWIHAHSVQGQSVTSQTNRRKSNFPMSEEDRNVIETTSERSMDVSNVTKKIITLTPLQCTSKAREQSPIPSPLN